MFEFFFNDFSEFLSQTSEVDAQNCFVLKENHILQAEVERHDVYAAIAYQPWRS